MSEQAKSAAVAYLATALFFVALGVATSEAAFYGAAISMTAMSLVFAAVGFKGAR